MGRVSGFLIAHFIQYEGVSGHEVCGRVFYCMYLCNFIECGIYIYIYI